MINPFESHTVLSLQEDAVEPTPECFDEFPAHTDTTPSKPKTSLKDSNVESADKGLYNVNTLQSNEIGIDHLVASGIPQEFAISTLPYFDATQVHKLWSRVQLETRRHAMDLPEEDVLNKRFRLSKLLC